MKITLTVKVEYDPNVVDEAGVVATMDALMEIAIATPGTVKLRVGRFSVVAPTTKTFPVFCRCRECNAGFRFEDSKQLRWTCPRCGNQLKAIEEVNDD